MKTIHVSAALLLAALGAAGCGDHEHTVRTAPRPEYVTAQENTADLVVRDARTYVTERGSKSGPPPIGAQIEAEDAMLESLFEAAEARRVAARALELTQDADVDAGRAARVAGSAQAVSDAADLVVRDAKSDPRAIAPYLAEDRKVLRAALRALRVDVLALEREAD
jgi:hypothetical protein